MSTIQQFLIKIRDGVIGSIERSNKRLLLAAVLFISLIWSLAGPARGFEKIVLPVLVNQNQKETQKADNQWDEPMENLSMVASSLASLTSQSESSEDVVVDFAQEEDLSTLQDNAIIARTAPVTFISQEARNEVIEYTVEEGDTLSSVAASFGISLNTLLWTNELKETSLIRPGDELTILPISGLIHRVKSGDTIGAIATKYKANTEKIIAFNVLPADGAIQAGQKLIIPDGQVPYVAAPSTRIASRAQVSGPGTGKSRSFPYGQCTWYVAQKRYVPWSGHAKSWLANSRAYGFKTGAAAQAGAIVVLSEGGWLGRVYGHVAYVEAVKGQWVTISEMNYTCYACKSVRTLHLNDRRIRGYIY